MKDKTKPSMSHNVVLFIFHNKTLTMTKSHQFINHLKSNKISINVNR